jgi:hypothetical protein
VESNFGILKSDFGVRGEKFPGTGSDLCNMPNFPITMPPIFVQVATSKNAIKLLTIRRLFDTIALRLRDTDNQKRGI